MWIAKQHWDGQREDQHDEEGGDVRGARHPNVDEAIVLAGDHIADITCQRIKIYLHIQI